MTTNPSNIVRVRARKKGRASVYEANAWAQAFSTGLLEGNGVKQNTSADMNVLVGGTTSKPDVVIASSPAGYKIALDIVGSQAIQLTTPASNSRISSIVAYTDDLSISSTDTDVTGSPSSCGLIVVNGAASASPVAPTDSAIRSAITADGATGSQACYTVLANVRVASTTTTITNSLIASMVAKMPPECLDVSKLMIASQNVDWATIAPTAKNVIKLGSRKIMWGEINDNWTNGGHNKTITLPESFADASYIITFGKRQSGSKPASFDQLNLTVTSRTASSFSVQVWNNVDYDLQFAIPWIAIG